MKGIQSYNENKLNEAINFLRQDSFIESNFILALAYFRQKRYKEAKNILEQIVGDCNLQDLEGKFQNLKIDPIIKFYITREILISSKLSGLAALLFLVEIYQIKGELGKAIHILNKVYSSAPNEPLILLSLIDIHYDYYKRTKLDDLLNNILTLSEKVELNSLIEGIILFYRMQALLHLGKIQELKQLVYEMDSQKQKDFLPKEYIGFIKDIKEQLNSIQ